MTERIGILALAQNVAQHAATRQKVIAQNVANADTPGYRAMDLLPFEVSDVSDLQMKSTSPLHFSNDSAAARFQYFALNAAADPNGNTVHLEEETLRAVEAGRTHSRAVTIYQSSLELMRSALGRR